MQQAQTYINVDASRSLNYMLMPKKHYLHNWSQAGGRELFQVTGSQLKFPSVILIYMIPVKKNGLLHNKTKVRPQSAMARVSTCQMV